MSAVKPITCYSVNYSTFSEIFPQDEIQANALYGHIKRGFPAFSVANTSQKIGKYTLMTKWVRNRPAAAPARPSITGLPISILGNKSLSQLVFSATSSDRRETDFSHGAGDHTGSAWTGMVTPP